MTWAELPVSEAVTQVFTTYMDRKVIRLLSTMVRVLGPADGYNLYCREYANDHRKLDSFDREEFLSKLPDRSGICLDLGVGDGRISCEIAGRSDRFIGLDVSLGMLEQAVRRIPKAELVLADLSKAIPIQSESVDMVTGAFFFVHIKNADPVISEVQRVLKSGGAFIFNLIPQRREPELRAGKQRFKIKSYYHSPPQIEKLLDYYWFEWEVETVSEGKGWVSKVYCCRKT